MDDHAKIATLQRLLDVSRGLAATVELQPLLEQIVDAARQVLRCERATVFLLDAATGDLCSRVATDSGEIRFAADQGIAGEVCREGHVCNVPDAYADARFNPAIDERTGFVTQNILAVPLDGLQGQRVGVIQLINRAGGFGPEDEELALTLAAQAGVALQRQCLLDQYASKLRLERELDIARDIQQQMLPRRDPEVPGYLVSGWNRPADQTGGDCFDFLRTPGGRLATVLADATGHGVSAALCIAQFRALMKASVRYTGDLAEVMRRVNDLLAEDLPDDRFVTAFLGELDDARHELEFVSAGQGPMFHVHRASGSVEHVDRGELPLGIVHGHAYELSGRVALAPGDAFCLFTDGFHEWADRAGAMFGLERLAELLARHARLEPAAVIRLAYDEVRRFAGGAPQSDDLTAIVVKRLD